jgi:outer membrane protein OmpA-like peptidoglycan-associated protein
LSSTALADKAKPSSANTTGPDFVNAAPQRHIPRSLVVSPEPMQIDPWTVLPFELDKARLTAEGFDEVDAAARWLYSHPKHQLVLEGHADALGRIPYNDDLSTRRMNTVRARLIRSGISSDRIVTITFGERESMDVDNPLHAADRKVVMYATPLSPPAVIAMVRTNRPAIYASYSEYGQQMRVEKAPGEPSKTIMVRR